jgi:calcium-dependent protein kinase
MLFFLLSGRLPFIAMRIEDFPLQVQREPEWSKMGGASGEAHEICRKMLMKRGSQRPSAQAALKERWFSVMGLDTGKPEKLAKSQMDALLKVTERGEFEKFITRLVATQVDASKFKQVNEAFAAFDTDNDGQLSIDELRQGLQRAGSPTNNVEEVFEELDVGGTGLIAYTEFLAGVINLGGKKSEEQDKFLWTAWQQFSPDENGRVNHANVQDALATRGMTVADLPERFLMELTKGASGELTFESFKKLLVNDAPATFLDKLAGEKARVSRFF